MAIKPQDTLEGVRCLVCDDLYKQDCGTIDGNYDDACVFTPVEDIEDRQADFVAAMALLNIIKVPGTYEGLIRKKDKKL